MPYRDKQHRNTTRYMSPGSGRRPHAPALVHAESGSWYARQQASSKWSSSLESPSLPRTGEIIGLGSGKSPWRHQIRDVGRPKPPSTTLTYHECRTHQAIAMWQTWELGTSAGRLSPVRRLTEVQSGRGARVHRSNRTRLALAVRSCSHAQRRAGYGFTAVVSESGSWRPWPAGH